MESSNQKNNQNCLYDPIRKRWVDKTPEECVRQNLIYFMIEKLGYPASLISIEKELSLLPHLMTVPSKQLPKRRADILVFAKEIDAGALAPLILIECKAAPLSSKFVQQVMGYNTFVKAPFIALANAQQIVTGSYDATAGIYQFKEGLPQFVGLKETVR